MKWQLMNLFRAALRQFDIGFARYERLQSLEEYDKDFAALLALPVEKLTTLASLAHRSKSQLRQDLFVLAELDFRKNGYFVEFGATNGIDLSNTYLLEKEFSWDGILAEPAKCWHKELKENRATNIETCCVWRDSNSLLKFKEASSAEISTIASYSDKDYHRAGREGGQVYEVKTISLNDLLTKYNAPQEIDYLSIDTEGSEFEILSNFDFDRHQIKVITCEHNFSPIERRYSTS